MESKDMNYWLNNKTEESKVMWVTTNTALNGLGAESIGYEYDYWAEAMMWAKGKDYFPDLSEEEFLTVARKYDVWNEFEKAYGK